MEATLVLRSSNKVKYNKREQISFIVFTALIYLLIIFGIAISQIFTIASFIIAAAFIAFSDIKKGIGLQFFLLSFQYIYKLNPNSFSLFSLLNVIVGIKLMVSLSKRRKGIQHNGLIVYLLFFFFVIIQTLFLSSPIFSTIGFLLNLFLLLGVSSLYDREIIHFNDINLFIHSFVLGIIVSSFTAVFKNYIPNLSNLLYEVYYKTEQVRTMRFNGLLHNPNWYSLDVIVALDALLVYLLRKRVFSFFHFVEIALLIVFGIMTLSKSFILSLIISLLLILLYLVRKPKLLFLFLGSAAVLFILSYLFFGDYLLSVFERLEASDTVAGITSGRTDIWSSYIEALFGDARYLFFGFGYINSPKYLADSHSLYFDFISYFGIFGGIVLLLFFVTLFSKNKKRDFLSFFVLLILLIRGIAINMLSNDSFYYYLILTIMLYRCDAIKKGGKDFHAISKS